MEEKRIALINAANITKRAGDDLVNELTNGVNDQTNLSEADRKELLEAIDNIRKAIQEEYDREMNDIEQEELEENETNSSASLEICEIEEEKRLAKIKAANVTKTAGDDLVNGLTMGVNNQDDISETEKKQLLEAIFKISDAIQEEYYREMNELEKEDL